MTAPSLEHLQRAFELARRPDWPATLAELLTSARQAALVQGLAHRLANGQGLALPEAHAGLVDTPPPATVPMRCWDYPPRRSGTRAAGNTERRRRDANAHGPDLKSLAAGERADD